MVFRYIKKFLFIFKILIFEHLTARENDFKWLIQENIFIIMWCQPCIIKERQEILNRTSPFSRTPSITLSYVNIHASTHDI